MIAREVAWPFALVADAAYRSVGWALVNGPIQSRAAHRDLAALSSAGYRFAGMCGFGAFPRERGSNDARDYDELCEAWLHCFRRPDDYLSPRRPRLLSSMSDFTDPDAVAASAAAAVPAALGGCDFVYASARDPWKRVTKNWALAQRAVPRMCEELGLRALVIDPPEAFGHPAIVESAPLAWPDFLAVVRGARFLFVPNERDPSPRVIAEALCLGVPVVVNRAILGGWKYVNAATGVFFDDESGVVAAVRACFTAPVAPRRWFRANHGPFVAGAALLRFLRRLDPAIRERDRLVVTPRAREPS